ncbi:hypothetical protein PULV_a0962 [Pseudoalteromonas ulvae UL12]|nr:hypothetical protein [Pseudoalteromonas ulvae UL12]
MLLTLLFFAAPLLVIFIAMLIAQFESLFFAFTQGERV